MSKVFEISLVLNSDKKNLHRARFHFENETGAHGLPIRLRRTDINRVPIDTKLFRNIAYKVFVFIVILVRIFPNSDIQSECGKIWTRKTPNTDTCFAKK